MLCIDGDLPQVVPACVHGHHDGHDVRRLWHERRQVDSQRQSAVRHQHVYVVHSHYARSAQV